RIGAPIPALGAMARVYSICLGLKDASTPLRRKAPMLPLKTTGCFLLHLKLGVDRIVFAAGRRCRALSGVAARSGRRRGARFIERLAQGVRSRFKVADRRTNRGGVRPLRRFASLVDRRLQRCAVVVGQLALVLLHELLD